MYMLFIQAAMRRPLNVIYFQSGTARAVRLREGKLREIPDCSRRAAMKAGGVGLLAD